MTEPGQCDGVPEQLGPRTARRLELPGGAEEARRDEEHGQTEDLATERRANLSHRSSWITACQKGRSAACTLWRL